jgi:hypothetical protein
MRLAGIFNQYALGIGRYARAAANGRLVQAYKQGWFKTFIYLMFNNATEDHRYGMLNHSAGPTLMGRYVHSLTSILADNSSAFPPSRVNYWFSGMPSTGHDLLMQKSNSKYDLAFGSRHLPLRRRPGLQST